MLELGYRSDFLALDSVSKLICSGINQAAKEFALTAVLLQPDR
jgi:hypothetical protein